MCMSVVYEKSDVEIHTGYKYFAEQEVFRLKGTKIQICGKIYSGKYTMNRWYVCKNIGENITYKKYPAGFHIFTDLKQVKRVRPFSKGLYKVEYAHVVARGRDRGCKTVVAHVMRIVEKIPQW